MPGVWIFRGTKEACEPDTDIDFYRCRQWYLEERHDVERLFAVMELPDCPCTWDHAFSDTDYDTDNTTGCAVTVALLTSGSWAQVNTNTLASSV